jgi:transketolase
MEGLSHETCSFAGEFQLNKLIVFFDCNGITIDGPAPSSIKHETIGRFKAYGWHVIEIDGHNHEAIFNAIQTCQHQEKPSLIICHTVIGLGSKNAGLAKVHGSPLDAEDIAQIKKQLNWTAPSFTIPDEIYNSIDKQTLLNKENDWVKTSMQYYEKHPELYTEFMRRMNVDLPDNWADIKQNLIDDASQIKKSLATRVASQHCLEILVKALPELIGGSADLTPSNNTKTTHSESVDIHGNGNYLHYGVREFGMMAIMNGLSAHQGFIPYGGTFLVFSDYARNAIRMSSMMSLKNIFVLTHDSIALGEDGPTHQPVEHLAMLRYTPNLNVWRPASPLETAIAWIESIEYQGTSCLVLSRQNLAELSYDIEQANHIKKGGYILFESHPNPDIIFIATGSEVSLAIGTAKILTESHIKTRVISMPCPEIFLQQSAAYQESVLPKNNRCRIAIEAASKAYWYQFVGLDGEIIGLSEFGRSAPESDVKKALGFDVDSILHHCKQLLNSKGPIPID